MGKCLAYEIMKDVFTAHGMSAGSYKFGAANRLPRAPGWSNGFTVIMPVLKHDEFEISSKASFGWTRLGACCIALM